MKTRQTKPDASAKVVLSSLQKSSKKHLATLALFEKADKMVIRNKQEYDRVSAAVLALKSLSKAGDVKKKAILDPLKIVEKEVRALFSPFEKRVELAESIAKSAMLVFVNSQQLKQAEVLEDFGSGKIKKIDTVLAKQSKLTVSSSTSSVRKVWRAAVANVSKIPREYMEPNMAAINEACKSGKSIPGVTWEQVNNIAI